SQAGVRECTGWMRPSDSVSARPLCGRYEIAGQRPVLGARQDDERHLVTTPSQALHLMRPLVRCHLAELPQGLTAARAGGLWQVHEGDRKSTRLNSSHVSISYAV